ncbi:MAG: GGDEF domain-containing protein [Bacteroides sp.]
MNSNFIEKYELIDGWAIVNNNFEVVSANENYYRFVGIARYYTLTDVIHQVDIDDFIEVANSLKTNAVKSMVVRMRRVDNSYRWILMDVRRGELHNQDKENTDDNTYEYLELKMSDIQAMQHQNRKLQQMINEYNHLLALEGELVFALDCREKMVTVFRFVDDVMTIIDERPSVEIIEECKKNRIIPDEDMEEFEALCKDFREGAPRIMHRIHINSTPNQAIDGGLLEFKASTYYEGGKKLKIVGTIKRVDDGEGFSKNLVSYYKEYPDFTSEDVLAYVKNSIKYNPSGEIMLLLLQIDNLDKIEQEYGKKAVDDIFNHVLSMCRENVKFRGTVGVGDNNVIYMAVKDVNVEINTRAFIESLRTMIVWKYRMMNNGFNLTFSIGVSRYPFNGKDYDKMVMKAHKALDIANAKGKNRFIIYKELLHGEL